jgi:hypothetical protein
MSTPGLVAATLAVLTVTACNPFHKEQAVEMSAADATLNTRWHANLASPGGLAGAVQMSGSASMAPDEDGTHTIVTLDLANATPGGLHPWGLHRGQCGTGTDYGVFGSSDAYEAVEVDGSGHAAGKATIDREIPRAGTYFVVVKASTANSGTVVACGNLASPTR